jgi:hypothetical protein
MDLLRRNSERMSRSRRDKWRVMAEIEGLSVQRTDAVPMHVIIHKLAASHSASYTSLSALMWQLEKGTR